MLSRSIPTNAPRRATLFTNGSNQAIRIPRDFELPGKEALIRKEGDRLIIEPVPPPRLLAVLATLEPIDEPFPDIHDPLPEPVDF
jgi:antitoxin VapB